MKVQLRISEPRMTMILDWRKLVDPVRKVQVKGDPDSVKLRFYLDGVKPSPYSPQKTVDDAHSLTFWFENAGVAEQFFLDVLEVVRRVP